ncbi:MAG TPA: MerR family transcriptional regulator [Lachnospiraceae bacterium]|nr:MerR family transcriptional regulator [Lachnospiraceae bacterium]
MYDTIAQASKKTGISIHTLRYYDREGLLPFIEHSPNGSRLFNENDYEWIAVLQCLKNTGMPLKQIRTYMDWCMQGDTTLERRLALFQSQKIEIERQFKEIQNYQKIVEYKINYLKGRIDGTEEKSISQF